jgi:hypothetical protein
VADRCREIAGRLAAEDGLERACDEIEAAWRTDRESPGTLRPG